MKKRFKTDFASSGPLAAMVSSSDTPQLPCPFQKITITAENNTKIDWQTGSEFDKCKVRMKTVFASLLAFALMIPALYALDETLFPIEIAYDTGIEHVYRFEKNGKYSVKFLPNEAQGFKGGVDSGTYKFKPEKGGGTIILENGAKIQFRLPKAPEKGQTVAATGSVKDPSGNSRYPSDFPISIKKL